MELVLGVIGAVTIAVLVYLTVVLMKEE